MRDISALLSTLGRSLVKFHAAIFGMCVVCGRPTVFLCPDPATARNNTICAVCGSTSRKRHVSKVVLREVFGQHKSIASIRDTAVKVLCASSRDPYIRYNKPGFVFCDLIPGVPEGSAISSTCSCQNLERLSFDSNTFDVVITEDVLEHVRYDEMAFREIHRVLRPGGLHIFTVPFLFDQPTFVRVAPGPDGDVQLAPPEYHGDPLREGILAFRNFGIDMFAYLARLQFSTTLELARYSDLRHGIVDSFVFISRKVSQSDTSPNN